MKKIIILLMLFVLLIAKIQAQEEFIYEIPRLHLGIEIGVNPLFGTLNSLAQIRQSQAYYRDTDYDYYCGFVSPQYQEVTAFSFGIKPEYLLKKRLALATGIRLHFCNSLLYSDRDCFLWKISETETSTNYVKIQNISQKNFYLELPLEVRLFPREKDYIVRHYFVFGAGFNFLVASISNIEFQNPKMEKYASKVLEYVGPPNFFQASVYAGIGLKFSRMRYPFGNIEIHFPTLTFFKAKQGSFVETSVLSIRFFTTLNIPVNRKQQLTYTVID
jgi:hypothetical protein